MAPETNVTDVDPATLRDALETGSVHLVDVREENERVRARIPGDHDHLPWSDFAPEQVEPPGDEKPVAFY